MHCVERNFQDFIYRGIYMTHKTKKKNLLLFENRRMKRQINEFILTEELK